MSDNELVNLGDCPEDNDIVDPDIAEVDPDNVQEVLNLDFTNLIDKIVTNGEATSTKFYVSRAGPTLYFSA